MCHFGLFRREYFTQNHRNDHRFDSYKSLFLILFFILISEKNTRKCKEIILLIYWDRCRFTNWSEHEIEINSYIQTHAHQPGGKIYFISNFPCSNYIKTYLLNDFEMRIYSFFENSSRILQKIKRWPKQVAETCRATCLQLLKTYNSTPFYSTIINTLTELSIQSLFHIPHQISLLFDVSCSWNFLRNFIEFFTKTPLKISDYFMFK